MNGKKIIENNLQHKKCNYRDVPFVPISFFVLHHLFFGNPIKFAIKRKAPGTPAGSCLKKTKPV